MKKGWEIKKLGEVYDVRDGTHDSPCYYPTGYPLVTSKNLKNGMIDMSNVSLIRKEDYDAINNRSKVDVGDVLFAMIGTIGNPVVVSDEPTFAIKNMALFKVPETQSSKYLLYYLSLKSIIDKMQKESKGATQKFVSLGYLRNFSIPIPPLSEQQRIVSVLDAAFTKIEAVKEKTAHNLQNTKELFQSELQKCMSPQSSTNKKGWEIKKLKEIGITQTGSTPSTNEKENFGSYISFIKPADVNIDNIGNLNYKNECLSEIGLQKGRLIKKDSILMVCIGATIGKTGFCTKDVTCNQQINALTPKKEYVSKFFYYAMISNSFQSEVIKSGKGAQATLPIINKTKWENLEISFPANKIEQQQIVSHLDVLSAQVKQLEANYNTVLANCSELKQSVLAKAFNGEI